MVSFLNYKILNMQETIKGWVILTHNHGFSGNEFMLSWTFSRTRKESIETFTKESGESWRYWYKKFNYRCVKASSTVVVNEP